MTTRAISILSVLQVGALIFGILITAIFCTISGKFLERLGSDLPAPMGYLQACTFRDHGIWFSLLIFAWAVTAAILSSRKDLSALTGRIVMSCGTVLLFLLGLTGLWYSWMAMSPFFVV